MRNTKYIINRVIVAVIASIVLSMVYQFTSPRNADAENWKVPYEPAGSCFELAALQYVNPFNASNDTVINFTQWMSQANNGLTANPNLNYDINYTDIDHSYVLYGDNLSNYVLAWEYTIGENISLTENGNNGTRSMVFPAGTNFITFVNRNLVPGDPFYDDYPNSWDLSGIITTQGQTTFNDTDQVQCFHKAHNLHYEPTWSGSTDYEDYDDEVLLVGGCSGIDIACRVSQVFNGVANTFKSVGEAIINGIAALFIPDTQFLEQKFADIYNEIDAQLGFLLYPFEFGADMLDAADGTGCGNNCVVTTTGTVYGSPLSFDASWTRNNLPAVWQPIEIIIKGSIVFSVAFMLYRKFHMVVKH